jgi:NAD+ synthase (glutamine-hydrolysing)
MRIAIVQMNPTVGDLLENARRIREGLQQARARGAKLVLFPEMALVGYPPLDLLEQPDFLSAVRRTLQSLAPDTEGLVVVLGAPIPNPSSVGKRLFNAAVIFDNGRIRTFVTKQLLPTYDVFDEYRYFEPGSPSDPLQIGSWRVGVTICEDIWNDDPQSGWWMYERNPVAELMARGANLLLNLSASPFSRGKIAQRNALLQGIATRHEVPVVMVNQVGANTELIFDGSSRVFSPDGRCILALPAFKEAVGIWDLETGYVEGHEPPPAEETEQVRQALRLGLRDYDRKTGAFRRVCVGMSGGIDSSLVTALAVEAFGPERVVGLSLPSRYSSESSRTDAEQLARTLGIAFYVLSIEPAFEAFERILEPLFSGTESGVAEENIQARSRAVILMALANKFGDMVLACGNKSEIATGYATLYGDMVGGLAPIGDLYKTEVYELAHHLNRDAGFPLIPESVFLKAPSAELRPGQKDTDTLPPYEILDDILRRYLEAHASVEEILAAGHEPEVVEYVLRLVDRNEYKRRQGPPVLRISPKAFGYGRRFPIVQRWTAQRMRFVQGTRACITSK